MSSERHDGVVIGGGQAGLAAGHFLARQGRRFVILEAAARPAAAWRGRWDSLRLFTPACHQIAEELSASREVHLSVGTRQTADSRIGRRMKDRAARRCWAGSRTTPRTSLRSPR